jgi:2-hydroxychromene-2-carboxylate isomerase
VQAYWELNEDIADESVLAHIAQHYSVALPPVFDDSIKDQLHQNTIRLATMGAVGVPCFIVNEHLYWGQDRLFLVERALGNPAAKPRRILSNNQQQPHTLVYYHDFGSHWSYLASLQVG